MAFRDNHGPSIYTVDNSTQRLAFVAPFDGFCVYQNDTNEVYAYEQSTQTWKLIASETLANTASTVGDTYVRTTRFAIISSGTSGTLTLPANSTVVLDDFGGLTDAVVSDVSSSKPTYQNVYNSSNQIVATSFTSGGAYALTSAPSSYPVAIIYRVRQQLKNFDSTSSDIIGGLGVEAGGNVSSPANSIDRNIAIYDGTTGRNIIHNVWVSIESAGRIVNESSSASLELKKTGVGSAIRVVDDSIGIAFGEVQNDATITGDKDSLTFGYADGSGSTITAGGHDEPYGSTAHGHALSGGDIYVEAYGGHAHGKVQEGASIFVSNHGSTACGSASGTDSKISATNEGSKSFGFIGANASTIEASGYGSSARGYCDAGSSNITASGNASTAVGTDQYGNLEVTGNACVGFGSGFTVSGPFGYGFGHEIGTVAEAQFVVGWGSQSLLVNTSGVVLPYVTAEKIAFLDSNKTLQSSSYSTAILANINDTLADFLTDAGNSSTSETDLHSYTVSANQFTSNGQKIIAQYGGSIVGSAIATRRIKLYFAGTAIFDSTALTITSNSSWSMNAFIIRSDSSTIRYRVDLTIPGAAAPSMTTVGSLGSLSFGSTIVIKTTGQAGGVGAASNDIVSKLGTIEFKQIA